MATKRRTLLVTDVRFWRRKLGSQARISALLEWLQHRDTPCSVLFVGELHADDRDLLASRFAGLEFTTIGALPEPPRWKTWDGAALASALRHKVHVALHRWRRKAAPLTFDSFFRPDHRSRFQALLAQRKPSTVVIEYARLAYLLKGADTTGMQTLVDTHDVLHQRWAAFTGADRSSLILATAQDEAAVLRRFDHVLAIQHQDARHFRESMRLPSVTLVMHAHQVRSTPWQASGDILMVGSNMPPNVDGARDFLQHWPRVFEALGRQVRLNIVGAVCDALDDLRQTPGLHLLGQVDALSPHYDQAQLVINPVGYGSGLKIKSVEALCHGRPLLTTEAGAEGLERSGATEAFVVAPGMSVFADECIRLMQDREASRALGASAARYAQVHFAPEAAYAALAALLGDD